MADKKPSRRRMGFWDAQDRMFKLSTLYRMSFFSPDRVQSIANPVHDELNDAASPEPDEELEDSELNDSERDQAIARERMRREGRG